ncbi:uncharacterized protein KNAG_0E02440 [Huiozyma naganishii CBS 8797]|uniref:NAD(P)-binding domain-containing protein n=1 Tax=Huiozyma naganishii (strain ATCC MYA-139 / BCRC 22969 / CBS 8797 / KCTC 17520 / NBRC 10181 / NCYC 3082 / Yp74L-3) TaxID=1071383 RepID=J7S6Q5_HUIN7|nr:hypothetical protein KNAG_0E02440 [Kazachstania naganishii CBS 8797]CCK70504.1 hypothetical protein KNAG_0E02440 [Kazachstania naganishii CBS 8797]
MTPLKVAIIGANGRIGRLLVDSLKKDTAQFATPLALVRNKEQQQRFIEEVGINASLTSIEFSSVAEIASAIKGYNAVVFCAGAGGKGMERIFTVDLDGCAKTLEACEQVGISRFIVVSAIKAEDRSFWWDWTGLREYYIAKRAADHDVRNSKLDYTIVQPGSLADDASTGKLASVQEIDLKLAAGEITCNRADVALFIKEALLHPKETNRKTVPLLNGDIPVEQFIKSL